MTGRLAWYAPSVPAASAIVDPIDQGWAMPGPQPEPSAADAARLRAWFASLGSASARLGYGGSIADVGCGTGAAVVELARAYPLATVHGFDVDDGDLFDARMRAERSGVGTRCAFSVAAAHELPIGSYDVVCFRSGLPRTPDPAVAARRAMKAVAVDGAVMIVEPCARVVSVIDQLRAVGFGHVDLVTAGDDHGVLAARRSR